MASPRRKPKPKADGYVPRERLSAAGYLSGSNAVDWIRANVQPGAEFYIATHAKALSGQIVGFWTGAEPLIDPWGVRDLIRAGEIRMIKSFWRGVLVARM